MRVLARGPLTILFSLALASLAGGADAATCRDPAGFQAWLGKIKQEAVAQGISASAVDRALAGVTFDQGVIRRDHGQGVFRQSFEQFSQRMVPPRLGRARALQKRYQAVFDRIEQRYGVSSPILLAIWGLETDFGAVSGNFKTIQSIATLAYDCRRSDMFKSELFYAFRMVEKGVPPTMRGAWAGEIGQTQFMPSTYIKYAVDFDGNGIDLNHDPADVLASTANFLKAHGWQRGAGWAPGQPNFAAIQEWNKSSVYSRTIAYFATRLAGGSDDAYKKGDAVKPARADDADAPAPRRRQRPIDMDIDQGGAGDPGTAPLAPDEPPPDGYRER